MGRLQNKVAFITGLASGIGAATSRRFLEEGAIVGGMDLGDLPEDLRGKVDALSGDVSIEKDVSRAVEAFVGKHGRVDILVNSAGIGGGGAVVDLDMDEWNRVINVNVNGTVLPSKYALRQMVKQGGGSVVNLASIEGVEGFSDTASYGTSKGAVIQLTRNLAVEYAKHSIRVNSVSPGLVESPLTAILNEDFLADLKRQFVDHHLLKRAGQPEEIAQAILFLASDEASFVTGHNLVVDGGYTAGRAFHFEM